MSLSSLELTGHRTMRSGARLGAVLLAFAAAACGPGAPAYETRIGYQVAPAGGGAPTAEDLETTRRIVEQRLDSTGIAAFRVTAEAPDRIVVEASPASVASDVRSLAAARGIVEFVPLGDTEAEPGQVLDTSTLPPLFTADWVAEASVAQDATGTETLSLRLDDAAARALAAWTSAHVGEAFAVLLDGVVLTAPVVREPIEGGEMVISAGVDSPSFPDIQALVTLLRLGPLPHPLREMPPA